MSCDMAQAWMACMGRVRQILVNAELPGIRVFADLDGREGADRQIPQLDIARIDNLVCRFGTARGTGDHVAFAQGVTPVAVTQFTAAFEDEEHFFFRTMAVERAVAFARRDHRKVVAELARTDAAGDFGPA